MVKLILIILLNLLSSATLYAFEETSTIKPGATFVPDVDNQVFRDQIINFVRSAAIHQIKPIPQQELNALDAKWNNHYQKTNWNVKITAYHQGANVGESDTHGSNLAEALKKVTELSLNHLLNKDELDQYRFKVEFYYYPARVYSFIEFGEQGLELSGSRVVIRKVDTNAIKEQIKNSQNYLLRAMHPQLHGFFKFYDAARDKQETLLRTIYSSSSLYTLIKLYGLSQDPELEKKFKPIANFILSNQIKEGPNAGGFYYGFDPEKNEKTCVVVVGTASKTIFTLLELAKFYKNDPQYLEAAKKAGDWLLTMVEPDGRVKPIASCEGGNWHYKDKQSLLYSGQVLSALSRLYTTTKEPRYQEGATKIAKHFKQLVETNGTLLGDEYRPANSISTSWVMMSFIDFAKVDLEPVYRKLIEQLANQLLSRQITNKEDVYSNGRYLDAMTTSGNGWINEVMGVLYEFCRKEQLSDCQRYRQAIILSSRWLLQNAYTKANTYNVKNPANAIGGFITNFTTQTVRTDAVCHGLNSLIELLNIVGPDEQSLLYLPERPLKEVLPLLRAGNTSPFD